MWKKSKNAPLSFVDALERKYFKTFALFNNTHTCSVNEKISLNLWPVGHKLLTPPCGLTRRRLRLPFFTHHSEVLYCSFLKNDNCLLVRKILARFLMWILVIKLKQLTRLLVLFTSVVKSASLSPPKSDTSKKSDILFPPYHLNIIIPVLALLNKHL